MQNACRWYGDLFPRRVTHALISCMSERSATHSERRSSSSGSVDGDAARRRRSYRSADPEREALKARDGA